MVTKVYIYEADVFQYEVLQDDTIDEEYLVDIPKDLLENYLELKRISDIIQEELRKYKEKQEYGSEE
jgi:hypothetical protein